MRKILFLHRNVDPLNTPDEPDTEDRFYTYGFGSRFARNFKKFYPENCVEIWRLDAYAKRYSEKSIEGILIKVFPAVKAGIINEISINFLFQLRNEIKKNNPILFVTHIHYWLLYQVLIFFKKSPVVASQHGEWPALFRLRKRKGLRKIKDFIDTMIEKKYLKYVDYFLVCDFAEIPYIKDSVLQPEIIMSSTGVNIESFTPMDKSEARKIIGWDPDKKYILYVGKLYSIKQAKEMIDIWKEIKCEYPDTELAVIGNRNEDEYYDYAADSGVKLLGRVLNNQLRLFYSASDVYVLFSLRDDYFGGIGIAPLESLACNTPVVSNSMKNYIGSNADDLCEIPGSLENYKNAIIKVLRNPGKYKNMHESVAEHYSYKKSADRMMKVFSEVDKKYFNY